jgi:uncharacterized membrane protein
VKLGAAGEARIRGYLFVIDRSLKARLPGDAARDALREIERHIAARVEETDAAGDEHTAVERILAELGTPLRVAQAYSNDRTLDEALLTGKLLPILQSIANAAVATVSGFVAALVLFAGYLAGAALVAIGLLKPIFPNHVGIWTVNGPGSLPTSLGIQTSPTELPAGGNWVILIGIGGGFVLLGLAHLGARAFLRWLRARRSTSPFPYAAA